MNTSRALMVGLLALTLATSAQAQSAIWLKVNLQGLPLELGDANRDTAQMNLRALIIGELKEPFQAWNWNPPDEKGALEVEVTFYWDRETNDILAKFAFPKLELVLPAGDKSLVKVTNLEVVAPLTHRPTELAKHLHENLRLRFVEVQSKWSEKFCAKVPVARYQPMQLDNPPLGILLPFKNPNYLWSWFDIRAKEPVQGDVTLAAQGLNRIVNGQLAAVIKTWGEQKIDPPANSAFILKNLQDIRVYMRSLEPTTNPDYQGPSNP
jgi:hypothetical protein